MIFTIHFWGFSPYFWVSTHRILEGSWRMYHFSTSPERMLFVCNPPKCHDNAVDHQHPSASKELDERPEPLRCHFWGVVDHGSRCYSGVLTSTVVQDPPKNKIPISPIKCGHKLRIDWVEAVKAISDGLWIPQIDMSWHLDLKMVIYWIHNPPATFVCHILCGQYVMKYSMYTEIHPSYSQTYRYMHKQHTYSHAYLHIYSQKTKSSLISCFCSRAYGESIFQMSSFLSTPHTKCIIWVNLRN